jgi:hypothetical protein
MGFLKKKKTRKVYSTSIATTRVFQDDLLYQVKVKSILEKIQKDLDSRTYTLRYGNSGAAQLFQYYLSGLYNYSAHLPTSTIGAVGVSANVIENILRGIESESFTFTGADYTTPSDTFWVLWRLQQDINYDVGLDLVTITTISGGVPVKNYYRIDSFEYDKTRGVFVVTLKTELGFTILAHEEHVTTITNLNPTTDLKRIVVTKVMSYMNTANLEDVAVFVTETVLSNTTEQVPVGTETPDIIIEPLPTTYYINPNLTITRTISAYEDDESYYIAEYMLIGSNRTKLWAYDPRTKVYPQLKIDNYTTINYESYPIVMFRNGVFSVDEWNISSKQAKSGNTTETITRPSSITKKRYEETTEILKSIGISLEDLLEKVEENKDVDKLQDAFAVIGVSPGAVLKKVSDTQKALNELKVGTTAYKAKKEELDNAKDISSITSQALYRMFDHIYKQLPPSNLGTSASYHLQIDENPYNARLSWVPQMPTTEKKVIGPTGTYSHSIKNETIKRQLSKLLPFGRRRSWFEGGGPTVYDPSWGRYPDSDKRGPGYHKAVYPIATRADGSQWIYARRLTKKLKDKPSEYVMEWQEVFPHDENYMRVVYFEPYTAENLIMQCQTSDTEVRTIRVGIGDVLSTMSSYSRTNLERSSTPTGDVRKGYSGVTFWENSISRGEEKSGLVRMALDDENLVIPLPVFAVEQMTYVERVSLIAASFHLVFYAAQYDKITYYKSTFFGKFLSMIAMAVMIVIAIIAPPTAPMLIPTSALVGMSVATVTMLAMVELMLIGLVLQVVLKIIASVVKDPALRTVLSIAAIIGTAALTGNFEGFTFDLKTAAQLTTLTVKGAEIYMGAEVESLSADLGRMQNSLTAFDKAYKERTEMFSNVFDSFNKGVSADFLVDLSIKPTQSTAQLSYCYSPSVVRDIMINGYRTFDALYKNDIEDFYKNRLQLGIIDN